MGDLQRLTGTALDRLAYGILFIGTVIGAAAVIVFGIFFLIGLAGLLSTWTGAALVTGLLAWAGHRTYRKLVVNREEHVEGGEA